MSDHVQARWLDTQTANQTVAVQVQVNGEDGTATWEFGDRTVDADDQVRLEDRANRLWAITGPDGTVETRAAPDASLASLHAVMREWLGPEVADEAVRQLDSSPRDPVQFKD